MTLDAAKSKALEYGIELYGYEIGIGEKVIDIGNSWVFVFECGEPAIPDIMPVEVNKQNGYVSVFYLPDIENFERLNNGKEI